MKRHNDLFERITAFPNLLLAAKRARRGKRFRPATALFHHRVESELVALQRELASGRYRPGPFRTFTIYDRKPRRISAAPYRDRVVHHAICNIVEPIFERVFIHDSYACRKGKGTHAADQLTRFMQSADYALQCDVRRYFPSIDHKILKALLRRKIACPPTLVLLDRIIDHGAGEEVNVHYFAGDDLFSPFERPRGLPIGNQTSQFFGNVYLNALDHFVKEELRFRRYLRYVDDFVLLADDRAMLWEARDRILTFLQENLRLNLHPTKQAVSPVTCGVNFVGYRIYPDRRRLLPENGRRFARRLAMMARQYRHWEIDRDTVTQRVRSWIGHAMHADTYELRSALFSKVDLSRA